MEKIVAITVTYNRTGTLFRCLVSLLEQSEPVYKILVIDNNSRIREKEILKQFASIIASMFFGFQKILVEQAGLRLE